MTERRLVASAVPSRAGIREWLGLATLMLPVLLVSVDNTVLSFALPQISRALAPTAQQLVWIVDIYPLVLAGLLVTMGTLGDRFGRRLVLSAGATGFAVASVWAALAPSAAQLIVARALIGLFGATLMPSTLALLRSLFVDDEQRRRAVAVWAATFAAGSAIGPIVGGVLLEHFAWGSVFLMAVPVLILFLVFAPHCVPESRDPRSPQIDALSVVWSVATMTPLVYGVSALPHGHLTTGVVALALGTACGFFFVRRQLHLNQPLLEVRLFRVPRFSVSVAANFASMFAMAGLLFFISQLLQSVLGLSALAAALVLLPGVASSLLFGLGAVPAARRFPLWVLVPAGLLLSAVGYALCALTASATAVVILAVVIFLVDAGAGLAETLTNDAMLAAVPERHAGAASAVSETAYEFGSALGVAVLGGTVTATYTGAVHVPVGLSPHLIAQASDTVSGAVAAAAHAGGTTGTALLTAARSAFEAGVARASWGAVAALIVAAVVVALVLRRAQRSDERPPADTEPRPEPADCVRPR